MIVTAVVLAIALAMMAVERMRPGRAWPSVRTWWLRAIGLNLVQVGIVFLAGSTWDSWFASHRARHERLSLALAAPGASQPVRIES
jgi:hypothetical protein